MALVYDSLKETEREKDFAKVRSRGVLFFQVGIIISSFSAGYLYEIWNPLPYFAYALSLVVVMVVYTFLEEPFIDSEKFSVSKYLEQTQKGIWQTFHERRIFVISIFYAIVGGFSWSWQVYFNQIYATEIGFTEIQKSWIFGIIRIVNSLIILFFFNLQNKFIKKVFIFLTANTYVCWYIPCISGDKVSWVYSALFYDLHFYCAAFGA